MTLDQIEYDVARGAMKAPDCFTQMRQHVQALEKRNAELTAEISAAKAQVPRWITRKEYEQLPIEERVTIRYEGEESSHVLVLLGDVVKLYPSPPAEQGPKCKTCGGCGRLTDINGDDVPGKEYACPDCATPSRVEERKCVCELGARPRKIPVCAAPDYVTEGSHKDICCGCGHDRACHEVATPGTEKKGERE